MMGFVLAAVSPAVIIPCLMSLSNRGYGVEKGKKNQTQNFDWNQNAIKNFKTSKF